ncbi:MAG: Hsp33 family molecular chaperone HslO [Sphingomonadaceae bacterium]
MNEARDIPERGTGFDRTLTFTVPPRHARGRVVRLGPVLGEILAAHDYAPPVKHLLAEALMLTAMLGSLAKEDGSQLTLQAQAKGGVVSLLVCDYRDGDLRGYAEYDAERLAEIGANPSLPALFGEGYLAITYDMPVTDGRYQGIVPLEGESLSAACEEYFGRSEQVPTLIRAAVRSSASEVIAGGLLVQHFPEGEEGQARLHVKDEHPEWEHVSVMAGSTRYDELVDPSLELEQLVWRLFHEEDEVRVDWGRPLARGCRCTGEHYADVLGRFPEAERAEMRDESGNIVVDCAFCSKKFSIAI